VAESLHPVCGISDDDVGKRISVKFGEVGGLGIDRFAGERV
jgi:hypothetical protein